MDNPTRENPLDPSTFPDEGANEATDVQPNEPFAGFGGHDASRRALFGHPEVVRDLILGYVDEPWVIDIDFSSLQRVPETFVTPSLRHRVADVIWTARWRDRDLYIVILVEFQRKDERYMAVRQLVYASLTLLDLVEKTRWLDGDGHLPPVLPIVLYNGDRPWRSPQDLRELFGDLPAGLERLQPGFRYLIFDEQRLPVDLEGPSNLMAAIAALEQGSSSLEGFAQALRVAEGWLLESPQEIRQIFYAWVTRVLAPAMDSELPLDEIDDLGGLNKMMEERIANWKNQWLAEGRKQGVQRGRRLGEAEMLKRQLKLKFRSLPMQVSTLVDSADDADLLRWADRILAASSLDEVFAD